MNLINQNHSNSILTRKNIFAIAIILFLTIITYLPLFQNGFVNWDDDIYIYQNPLIEKIDVQTFFSRFYFANYSPLLLLVYSIIYKFFGFNPDAYHAVNLIFHLLNTALVFFIFMLLIQSFEQSFIISILFGIHPLHVESVAWASELKDVLYSFFFLLALFCYIGFISKANNWRLYILTFLFFLFAVLSKATAISFALILPLVDFFLYRKVTRKTLIEKAPFFIVAIIFGYIAGLAAYEEVGVLKTGVVFNFAQRILFASYSFFKYIQLTLFPLDLSAFYSYPIHVGEDAPLVFFIFPLLLVLLLIFTFYTLRFNRKIFFSIGFYALTIAMMLQIIPSGEFMMADRYSYLPAIGIFILLAMIGTKILSKFKSKYGVYIITMVGILPYSIAANDRVRVWRDSITLWTDTTDKTKNSPIVYNCLGTANDIIGNYKAAIFAYNKAIELNPYYAEAYFNRGMAKAKSSDIEGCIFDFTKTITIDPNHAGGYYNRGNAYLLKKDFPKTIDDFTMYLAINPNDAYAYKIVGYSKIMCNDVERGCVDLKKAIYLGDKDAISISKEFCD